jgi:hypothetical protein
MTYAVEAIMPELVAELAQLVRIPSIAEAEFFREYAVRFGAA